MELGKHVLDKEILDSGALRCGKVDDLVLELGEDGRAELVAIVSGPLAFTCSLGRAPASVGRRLHRLLGVADPRPFEIGWEHVTAIDVVVHIDLDSEDTPLQALSHSVSRLFRRLPGA